MTDDGDRERLSPDEAFATLSDPTRLETLQVLARADGPLSFSELYDRVGADDSGGFNYHLERLVGHFVRKGEDGYALRPAGHRVVEAVLSGAVTEEPAFDRARVDEACALCGAPIEVGRDGDSLAMYCTECPGRYEEAHGADRSGRPAERGYLGRLPVPSAGLRDRTPDEALRAAWTWANLDILSMAAGICPRCAGPLEYSLSVCPDHDAAGGRCETCGTDLRIRTGVACPNCTYSTGGAASLRLVATTEMLSFLVDHGINPVSPASISRINGVHGDYEERLLSRDPFRARFVFDLDGDRLALTVDDDFAVLDATRGLAAEVAVDGDPDADSGVETDADTA